MKRANKTGQIKRQMKTKDKVLFGHLLWVEPRIMAHAARKALSFLGTQHQLHLLLNMIRYDWTSCNCKEVSWPRVLMQSQEEDGNRRCWTPRLPRDASHTFNIFYYKVLRGGSENYSRINRVWLCKERRQAVDFWNKGWSHPRIEARNMSNNHGLTY